MNFARRVLKNDSKSNQDINLQESESEEPSYASAILNGTKKRENSMFYTVDGKKYHSFTGY